MTEQSVEVLELMFGFLAGFLTQFLLHFIDIHRYVSPAILRAGQDETFENLW